MSATEHESIISNDDSETAQNEATSELKQEATLSDCLKTKASTKESLIAQVVDDQSSRGRSASRSSSLADEPKSYNDSISAASVRPNWSVKEFFLDDPSISSIKGDSVSATIADFDRKYHTQRSDNQSKSSARLGIGSEASPRYDDESSKINFFPTCQSSSNILDNACGSSVGKATDSIHLASSSAHVDAFEIIEESGQISSCDDLERMTSVSQTSRTRRHRKRHQRRISMLEQALQVDELPSDVDPHQIEPIIIRGNGNITLFGLSNSFSSDFPPSLVGRISREEFDRTMRKINSMLRDQQSLSAKILIFGGLCCCCSLGFSLVWPSIALKKRSKTAIQKFLASENNRLYCKLGLNWKLAEQRCYTNHAFVEYVLMIEFTPKMNLYAPD